jgi:hypothetical protein
VGRNGVHEANALELYNSFVYVMNTVGEGQRPRARAVAGAGGKVFADELASLEVVR